MELLKSEVVQSSEEKHYAVKINGNEIWVMKYRSFTNIPNICPESNTEIIKGEELLGDEEVEEVIKFVNGLE